MRELTGSRGWVYACQNELEQEIEKLRDQLEGGAEADYKYLCGEIHGIRVAIRAMLDARSRFNRDRDADVEE